MSPTQTPSPKIIAIVKEHQRLRIHENTTTGSFQMTCSRGRETWDNDILIKHLENCPRTENQTLYFRDLLNTVLQSNAAGWIDFSKPYTVYLTRVDHPTESDPIIIQGTNIFEQRIILLLKMPPQPSTLLIANKVEEIFLQFAEARALGKIGDAPGPTLHIKKIVQYAPIIPHTESSTSILAEPLPPALPPPRVVGHPPVNAHAKSWLRFLGWERSQPHEQIIAIFNKRDESLDAFNVITREKNEDWRVFQKQALSNGRCGTYCPTLHFRFNTEKNKTIGFVRDRDDVVWKGTLPNEANAIWIWRRSSQKIAQKLGIGHL